MKVAFTTPGKDLSAPMDRRLGRAPKFLIYDTDAKNFTVVANKGANAVFGAGIKAAETVVKSGAKALVTGECGPNAFSALSKAGVKVYSTSAATVGKALELFLAGRLTEIEA
jgi:predicted Fe-Mo cluster-binding NifX family protein